MTAPSTDVIAHRGFAGAYPENTVGAARAAARDADAIEIDVVPTADGDVVAFHDHRLGERDGREHGVTDADGVVWETDTETVTSARVLGTDETVPLLADVLDAIPSDVGVTIELKNPGSFGLAFAKALPEDELARQVEVWRPFVEGMLAVLEDFDNDVRLTSFYEAALASATERSEYPVAPLVWDSLDDGLEIVRRYDAAAIHVPYRSIRGTPFYEPGDSDADEIDVLDVAHAAGCDVTVYTVMTWYQAAQLADAGVDGLIADYPGLLHAGSRRED